MTVKRKRLLMSQRHEKIQLYGVRKREIDSSAVNYRDRVTRFNMFQNAKLGPVIQSEHIRDTKQGDIV